MGDGLTNRLVRPSERSGSCIDRIVRTVDHERSQRVKCDLGVQGATEELLNTLPLRPHGTFPPAWVDPPYFTFYLILHPTVSFMSGDVSNLLSQFRFVSCVCGITSTHTTHQVMLNSLEPEQLAQQRMG